MSAVIIGKDAETGQAISLDDIERQSGLYILGIQGSGKTTLIKSIIEQDIENGHGVFFLDPHGDAIEDLQKRIPAKRQNDVIILNPADALYSFGMNLLACPDPNNMTERSRIFAQAIDIFKKLFANPQTEELDILLNQYLRNSFFPLIANQDYTIAEIPLFLEEKQFRDRLLQSPSIRPEVVRFWHNTFDRMPPDDKREEIASTLRRLDHFGDFDEIRHIVGQSKTTIDFTDIMNTGKILFVKLSKTLPGDAWRIIGTILISNLVHAVLQREQLPQEKRRHFCIFVDEFQNFASSDDFAVLFTQARKYAIATTIAHQERYGQFADNKRIAGATAASVNKIFFKVSVHDAREHAPEFAKEATTTETRLEPVLVISQSPFWDLLNHGHTNAKILSLFNKYLRRINDWLDVKRMDLEAQGLDGRILQAESNLLRDQIQLAQVDERQVRLISQYASDRMSSNYGAIANTEAAIEKLIATHKLSEQEAFSLKLRFSEFSQMRLRVRNINRFLSEIMQQDTLLLAAQEQYAQFFIDILVGYIGRSANETLMSLLKMYLQLEFGDPTIARSIPAYLGFKYWPQELEKAYMDMRRWRYIEWYREKEIKEKLPKGYYTTDMKSNLSQDLQNYRNNEKTTNYQGKPVVKGVDYYSFSYLAPGYDQELPDLLPRILTSSEIKTIKDMCYNELLDAGDTYLKTTPFPFQVIEELQELCQLLSKPENHIKVPSGQYVEKQVHVRPVHDMTDEMAQELIDLRPHTAYVKSSWKGKIQTLGVAQASGGQLVDVTVSAWNNAIANRLVKPRTDIEEEIRERQENWRRRPGNEPPPPTHTGGNTPPSSGSTGSDREPPPPNTTSEEKPPGNSASTQSRTGITARGEANGSQEGNVIDFSSYQQKRRENEIAIPIKSPDTIPDEPIPSRLSPVPDLQTKQTPALEFVSLQFFESGKGYPQKEQRQYSTRFPHSTARFVNFEFNVRNLLYRQRNQTHHMWVRLYNPNGGLLWEDQHGWDIEADCEHTWHTWGWGNAEPGRHWARGTYRVVILMDGVEYAEGSFTITDLEEPLPTHSISKQPPESPLKQGLALELESLRFFESGQGLLATEQRQYSTSFQQQTARCICFELTMRNMLYRQRDKRYLVKTRYVKPDGSHLMNHQEETFVKSDNEWPSYQWGLGGAKPGFWTPGTYRVEILIAGVKFAEGSFTIE